MSHLIHSFHDRTSNPWPDTWRVEDLRCISDDHHLAPLDVLLPGDLLVRVLHPYVANHDRPGSYEILRYLSIYATDKGFGRGLSVFATLDDPLSSRPKGRGDVLAGLARALDAAVGAEARRTRLLLQAFLRHRGNLKIEETDIPHLYLRIPTPGRRTLRLLRSEARGDVEVLARRIPQALAERAWRLRAPNPVGALDLPLSLPWIDVPSAHALLAVQADLEAFLSNT
jgi:hypothetical protein